MLVSMLLLHRQVNVEHEVGRMAGCGQRTCSPCLLVDWAAVRVPVVYVRSVLWNNVDHLHFSVEHLWIRFLQSFLPLVPSTALHEETVNVNTVLRSLAGIKLCLVKDLVVHIDLIDSNDILSSIVLLGSGEE